MSKLKLVEVSWGDAWGNLGWRPVDDAHGCTPMDVKSIGYLIESSKHGITLASSVDEGGKITGVHFVPRHNVQRVRTLR